MMKKQIIKYLITILVLALWSPISSGQSQTNAPVQALILLNSGSSNAQQLAQVKALVEESGGRATHIFPYQAVIATVPSEAVQALMTLTSVAAVFTDPVELAAVEQFDPQARRWAAVWNDLIAPQPSTADGIGLIEEHPLDDQEDAFLAPDLPADNVLDVAGAPSITPGYYQTSEYMAGSVAVGIILVESNGALDPSSEDWTSSEKTQVFSEIVAGLNWWAELDARANLSFVYDDHFSNPLPTSVEPITRPYGDQQYWITEAMAALGYNAPSYFTRVRDYNSALRNAYQTDWAFTIFVVDSSADGDNRFSDGFFAYAYLGGPYLVMTYGNNGYGPSNMDAVAAHEVGHIFHARDQYPGAYQACTYRSGYLDVENQNSQYGNCIVNDTSIMRGQIFPYQSRAIDSYAAGQVGWRDSDGDSILDPLDTALPVNIGSISQTDDWAILHGTAEIVPYPSPSRTSVTINTLTGVKYRVNQGAWQFAQADDGVFDETSEGYSLTVKALPAGRNTLEMAALDTAGNVSDVYASTTIDVFDPVDGGLNTELYPLTNGLFVDMQTTIHGTAYDLAGNPVKNVEYRINGDAWRFAEPADGIFDSDYESFTLPIKANSLGKYVVDARAMSGAGHMEVNFASQEIEITNQSGFAVFMPLVAVK